FFFSSRRRHTRFSRDWSSDVCSSDLSRAVAVGALVTALLVLSGHPQQIYLGGVLAAAWVVGRLLDHRPTAGSAHPDRIAAKLGQIGRASCRERRRSEVCADNLHKNTE